MCIDITDIIYSLCCPLFTAAHFWSCLYFLPLSRHKNNRACQTPSGVLALIFYSLHVILSLDFLYSRTACNVKSDPTALQKMQTPQILC